jgi:hypothetical protein
MYDLSIPQGLLNLDMDHATKELLIARRNATHGFGHWRSHDADNVRIRAHHDARLPRDIVHYRIYTCSKYYARLQKSPVPSTAPAPPSPERRQPGI